jgi:hypothetical protein
MFETSLGPAQHHENLTIFPILAERERELPYLLLAEALAVGILTIGEKNGGQVPVLLATNAGQQGVLVLDGEQLIGAKQNRMTNRSILLPPESITEIPVSCMEQGRWHFQSDHFAPAPQHAPSKVRRRARETEAEASYVAERRSPGARSSHRDLAAAQGEVWDEIRSFGDKLGGTSHTGALDSIYENRRTEMEGWIRAFPLVENQVGLVAFQGETPLATDAVGSPALYAKIHARLLTGYVLDAMEGWDPHHPAPQPSRPEAEFLLEALGAAERVPSHSVGAGEYRILRGRVLGGELIHDDRVVHVSAFPADEGRTFGSGPNPNGSSRPGGPRGTPIARPSRRRRGF